MNRNHLRIIHPFRRIVAVLFCAAAGLVILPAGHASRNRGSTTSATFSKDVAPIFFKSCAHCHRPGEIAPFSVLSYKDVRPWAKSIREKVVSRTMPPWHADSHYGEFSNDARLSQSEIDIIVAWVDGGAREGNRKDLPPVPNQGEQWSIGTPDLTVAMTEEFKAGSGAMDQLVHIRLPTNFTEDKWVQAAELRPGNKTIVHHAVIFVEPPQMYDQARAEAKRRGITDVTKIPTLFEGGGVPGGAQNIPVINDACGKNIEMGFYRFPILCSYLPGRAADEWPAGAAKLIPAGSNLILQMHYSKTDGQAATDRSSLALRFAKEPVEKEVKTLIVINPIFQIPAGAERQEITACHTLPRDVQVVGYMPHMHLRGQDMKCEVVYPDQRRETLLSVNQYDFNWQTFYKLKQPLPLPKGTRMIVTAHFDNSARNKRNPDPNVAVKFGQQTRDEMMVLYVDTMSEKTRAVAKLDPKLLELYAGEYEVAPGMKFTILRENNQMFLVAPGYGKLPAVPESETKFNLDGVNASCSFIKNDQGEVKELVISFGERIVRARKRQNADAPAKANQ